MAIKTQTLKLNKNVTILFTFKRLKPGEVEGVGQLTVNSPEIAINCFSLITSNLIYTVMRMKIRSLFFNIILIMM